MVKIKRVSLFIIGILAVATLCYAGATNFSSVITKPIGQDNYGVAVKNSAGSVTFSADSQGKATISSFGVASNIYYYNSDWVLSNSEGQCLLLVTTSGYGSVRLIAPSRSGATYIVRVNGAPSLTKVTIRTSNSTGVDIANGKTAVVFHDGTDYRRVTADSTN